MLLTNGIIDLKWVCLVFCGITCASILEIHAEMLLHREPTTPSSQYQLKEATKKDARQANAIPIHVHAMFLSFVLPRLVFCSSVLLIALVWAAMPRYIAFAL